MPRANKFAKSLKSIELNTNVENQGTGQEAAALVFKDDLPPDEMAFTPPPGETQYNLSPEAIAQIPVSGPIPVPSAVKILDKLETKGVSGKTMTVYINNELLARLDRICREKNVSRSKAVNAILEQALTPQV